MDVRDFYLENNEIWDPFLNILASVYFKMSNMYKIMKTIYGSNCIPM